MLKKLYLSLLTVLLLTACGSKEENKSDVNGLQTSEADSESKKEGSLEVDKNLLSVEVTIPASMIQSENIDQVIADAKAEGIEEATQNSDGSVTYKMSKSKHKEMIKEMEGKLKSSIEEMKTSEDLTSIKDITHNKSFSEYTMIVDREAYENSFDGFAAFGLGLSGMMYQLFDGVKPDNYKVTIEVKDESTGEVFDTSTYPDDLGK